jgi:hypothetical protein
MSWTHVRAGWQGVRDLLLGGGEASEWLRDALRSGLAQDARRVANDAELLVAILRGRYEDLENGDSEPTLDLDELAWDRRARRESCLRAALRRGRRVP